MKKVVAVVFTFVACWIGVGSLLVFNWILWKVIGRPFLHAILGLFR